MIYFNYSLPLWVSVLTLGQEPILLLKVFLGFVVVVVVIAIVVLVFWLVSWLGFCFGFFFFCSLFVFNL